MNERKRERELLLACSPIGKPESAVLITICSMNIHQYDSSNFQVPHVWPSKLAKHIRTSYYIEVIER